MTSYENIRDQKEDHLLTPENCALLIIDYQPTQVNSINSMNRSVLIKNIAVITKLAKSFNIPIVLSTVNVAVGQTKKQFHKSKRF